VEVPPPLFPRPPSELSERLPVLSLRSPPLLLSLDERVFEGPSFFEPLDDDPDPEDLSLDLLPESGSGDVSVPLLSSDLPSF
jgi:hypothetical protein